MIAFLKNLFGKNNHSAFVALFFANAFAFIIPFIFLNANSLDLSLILMLVFLVIMFVFKNLVLNSLEKNQIYTVLISLCLAILLFAIVILLFYLLGYNHIFFKSMICIVILLLVFAVFIGSDLFWIIVWKKRAK